MIIDADGHVNEPLDVLAEFIEPVFRSRRPIYIKDTLGLSRILLEGKLYPETRLRQRHTKGVEGTKLGGVRPGASDAAARIGDLDLEGFDIQVIYGSLGLGLTSVADPEFGVVLARACNDYYADFCRHDPMRLRAMAALPVQDVPAAVEELTRCVTELGLLGGTVPPNVNGLDLDHESFEPLWAEAERLNVPIGVHWGNGAHLRAAGTERFNSHFMVHAIGHPFEQMIALAAIMTGGAFDRHPGLRVGFLEAGCGWAPYWVERLHEHWERRGAEMPGLGQDPFEYFRKGNAFVSCEPDEALIPAAAAILGSDRLLFSSDYPHTDSKFPECTKLVRARDDLDDAVKEQILGGNAEIFYNFSGNLS